MGNIDRDYSAVNGAGVFPALVASLFASTTVATSRYTRVARVLMETLLAGMVVRYTNAGAASLRPLYYRGLKFPMIIIIGSITRGKSTTT
jgi:hypothetical protein